MIRFRIFPWIILHLYLFAPLYAIPTAADWFDAKFTTKIESNCNFSISEYLCLCIDRGHEGDYSRFHKLEASKSIGVGARDAAVTATEAGERFVRVGARPDNLKFTFETPGGVQPGTYAFPEKTFLEFGNNPAAIKNFGDLPGAAPEYFRILEPPAGTLIQRGIVPGGEYGGVGLVPEVIFPKGF